MRCELHPAQEVIGTCTNCGQAICDLCAVNVQGRLVCKACLERGHTPATHKASDHDPNLLFVAELVGGFLGLLGLGYLLAGRTEEGLIRLIVWLVYDVIAIIIITALSAILIGLICIPFQLMIQIGVPLWSAFALKKDLESQAALL